MRTFTKTLTSLALVVPLLLGTASTVGAAKVDGLEYRSFRRYQTRIHVLTVDLKQRTLRSMPVDRSFPLKSGRGTVPKLGRRWGAMAAINGDFKYKLDVDGTRVVSQPKHAWMKNREIWSTGVGRGGVSIALRSRGGRRAQIGPTTIRIVLRQPGKVPTWVRIARVNFGHAGVAEGEAVVAFTPRGGTAQTPKPGLCHTRLYVEGGWRWTEDGKGQRTYRLDTSNTNDEVPGEPCEGPLKVEPGTIVIESHEPLDLEESKPIIWTQDVGLPFATELIGGIPQVLDDRRNVTPPPAGNAGGGPDGSFYGPNPRTAIGVNRKGTTLYLVTVDGRRYNQAGVKLKRLGKVMSQVGAWDAFNLDGGGGSVMWWKGRGILNRPSERPPRPAMVGVGVF